MHLVSTDFWVFWISSNEQRRNCHRPSKNVFILYHIYNIATKTPEIIKAIENDIITNHQDMPPPEVTTAIESSKNALSHMQNERQTFEALQVKVFFMLKRSQFFSGESTSKRVSLERQRNEQRDIVVKWQHDYESAIQMIENLVEVCNELNLNDLCQMLLSNEAEMLAEESKNRNGRVKCLDELIKKAKRKQVNGGLPSSSRSKLEGMQRMARNEVSNLDQRVRNIQTKILSYT